MATTKIKSNIPLVIITVFLAATIGIFVIIKHNYPLLLRSKNPTQTGGDVPQQVPATYIKVSEAMAQLNSQLPLNTNSFSISFDYSIGKYVVTPNQPGINISSDFEKWYEESGFTAIPQTRFIISL